MTLSREAKVVSSLAVLTVLSRATFADPYLFNIDSGNFALALDNFDVSVHQPHPPGYFLYVMTGRLARLFTGEANAALIAVSIFFSALLVVLVYLMGKMVFGHREGIAAAVIALTSPLLWFHGIVALSYATEGFFSLAVAYLCYRISKGEGRLLWASAVVLGIAGGFRQNTLVFLLPLWFYSIRHQGVRRIVLSVLVVVLASLGWFLPMVQMSGGYGKYAETLGGQISGTVMPWARLSVIPSNVKLQLFFLTWGLLAALVPLIGSVVSWIRKKSAGPAEAGLIWFFLLWLMPSVLFYVFIFSRANNPGYSLVYMAGLYLLAGKAALAEASRLAGKSGVLNAEVRRPLYLLMAAIVAVNTLAFFMLDFRFSYRGLSKSNRRLEIYLEAMRRFPPQKTVVFGSQHYYVSTRHVAYYLPEYTVYSVPAVVTPAGERYFKMKGGNTTAARGIDLPPGTEYIVFFEPYKTPLPEMALKSGACVLILKDGFYMLYYCRKEGHEIPVEKILSSYKEDTA